MATAKRGRGRPARPSTVPGEPRDRGMVGLHVRLAPDIDAQLRRLAEAQSRTLRDTITALIAAAHSEEASTAA